MDEYTTPKKAREILQITNKTLRIWDKEGKIRTIRTPTGHRRYHLRDCQNIALGITCTRKKQQICYCRVSSKKQVDDLERQKSYFQSRYPDHKLITDIGSGLNWKRKGLKTILDLAMRGCLSEVVVSHRDRLCRFAFELLEWILIRCEVQLVVLNSPKGQSSDCELADDILSIVHVYSCRQMGKRRYRRKESPTLPDGDSEADDEEVDGDETLCLQPSTSLA